MKLRGDDSSERERTVIERQVSHLTRLVDDLLDVSRIARGKVELKEEVVEIAVVVARAIEMASPLLEQRTHTLAVDVPRHGLSVLGDPTRLGQVVSNLLTNAAKYTPPGGHITVRAEEDGADVVLRVRDTGIGTSSSGSAARRTGTRASTSRIAASLVTARPSCTPASTSAARGVGANAMR